MQTGRHTYRQAYIHTFIHTYRQAYIHTAIYIHTYGKAY